MSLLLSLAALALVAAPGLGWTLAALGPRRLSLIAAAGLAVPVGFASIAVVALALAIAHIFTRPVFVAAYAILAIAAWVLALRASGLRERGRAWRAEIVAEPWVHGTWVALMAGFGVVRATYYPELNLMTQTALRYWADGLEIADAHHIPALSLQWGHLFPSTVSKVALNAFDGGMSFVLGRGPLAPMGALLFATSIGAALVAFALGRELGLRWTAGLLLLAWFANSTFLVHAFSHDLEFFRAETVARVAGLGAMVLLVRAVRTGSLRSARREAVIAGALAGVCAGTHLVAFVVVAAFAGCYLLTAFAFQRTRAVLAVGLAAGLVTAGIGLIVLLAPGGTLGFKGTADTATYASISAQLGLPRTFDPTWFLAKGSLQPPPRAAGAFAVSPSSLGKEFVRRITDQKRLSRRGAALVAVVGLASLGLVLWRGDRVLKIAAIAAVLLAVTLLAVALLFSWRYNVYVLSHFGPRRLYDYEAIPTIVLMVAAIETLLAMLGRTPAGTTRAWLAPASATVIVAVAALVLLPRDTAPTKDRAYLTSALKPLSWIADNVPCSGRILADRRTLGTFQTMTGHAGLLEGMGPYFRPDVLQPALAQLFAARAFFAHPDSVAYLQQQGVAAVVVSGVSQSIGGAAKVGPVDEAALASSPFLQVVASSPAATVYRVVGFDPSWTAGMPTAAGRPGFECRAA